jgi:hypothetical protein
MGARTYQGEPGGLYFSGNVRPAAHEAAGMTFARAIGPMDAAGTPNAQGHYAFVSIGMSNTTQEFSTFKTLADADPLRDPHLVIVDGAQGGQTAALGPPPACACWTVLDDRLRAGGISARQVATAWIKLANSTPAGGWPRETQILRDQLAEILRMLKARFPNLMLAYLSSRIYGGYATTLLNPEPYAYEGGFAVKWVVDTQVRNMGGLEYGVDGSGPAPWVSWGPYLWADGLVPRSDGLTWSCSDFGSDGTHPSADGRRKVAQLLLDFVHTDRTAREWYLSQP